MEALQWLENKGNVRGVSAVFAYYCFSSGINFLVSLAFVNILPETEYGTYRFIFSLSGIFQIFLWSGITDAVTRATAKGEDAFIKEAVRFRMMWSLPLYGACVGALAFAYHRTSPGSEIGASLLILAVCAPFIGAYSTYQSYLQGKKAFTRYALWGVVGETAIACAMVAALLYSPHIVVLVGTYAASQLLVNAIFYRRALAIYRPRVMSTENHLRYGQHLTAVELVGTIAQQLDRLMLFHFWGATALARYAVIQMIPQYAYSTLKSTGIFFAPQLASRTRESIDGVFYRSIGMLASGGIVIGGSYALVAPFVFPLLFPSYGNDVFYSQLLGIDMALALPMSFIGSAFVSQKMIRAIYLNNAISSSIKIALYAICGIYGGVGGIVSAYIAGRIFGFIVNIAIWECENGRLLGKSRDAGTIA